MLIEKLLDSTFGLEKWIEKNDYKAYDPFDGLESYLRPLTFHKKILQQLLQQFVRRFPLNIRPILGIKKSHSSKAMGFFARGYLRLYQFIGGKKYLEQARYCLDWLIKNRSKRYRYYGWGNHFDYQSRTFYLPKEVPTTVWTSHIGFAFLDAYEVLREQEYLEIAEKSAMHIINEIGYSQKGNGTHCILYIPYKRTTTHVNEVHNANVLGAALLARLYKNTKKKEYLDISSKAIEYTVNHQLSSGGWYYAEAPICHWIDNFHTAYVLDSIKIFIDNTEIKKFDKSLKKGYKFYTQNLFEKEGIPKYYYDDMYPVDIQCCSQAIDTLCLFDNLELAEKVVLWTIRNMQDNKGYFYFRKGKIFTNKTPTLHWGQATMLSALTHFLLKKNRMSK